MVTNAWKVGRPHVSLILIAFGGRVRNVKTIYLFSSWVETLKVVSWLLVTALSNCLG